MDQKNNDFFADMFIRMSELQERGLVRNELADQLTKEFASGQAGRKPGLHDFFNVSDEEEASWYDMTSVRIRSFEKLMEILEKEGTLDARIGYIRKAIRYYSEDCHTFFRKWLSMLEGVCRKTHFDSDSFVGNHSLVTFMSICYFAAEFHMTEMYQPILRIVNELHRSDPEDEYMPISDFVYQNLTSVFYAVFDGDFAALRDSLLDPEMDDEIRDHLAFMLLQLILDGILSEEKRDQMLDQYLQFVFDQGAVGDAAAHWIVRTGQVNQRKKQLRKLLTYHVNPMYYGMTDPTRFEMMVMERSFSDCRKGIVMDDMILHGMYPKVIHPPKEIRNRAVSEQDRRIREMIQQQNQQAGG